MEHETFWSLLHDAAHWEFEIFLMVLFDGVLGLLVWPFVSKHWKHHLTRDEQEAEELAIAKFEVARRKAFEEFKKKESKFF